MKEEGEVLDFSKSPSPIKNSSSCKKRSNSIPPGDKPIKMIPSTVRSPFNMTSNLDSEIKSSEFNIQGMSDRKQVNYETLVNYWNTNQVIHISGNASLDGIELLKQTLKETNKRAKIYEHGDDIQ